MKSEFFECECRSDEHMFKFVYDPTEHELGLNVYLHNHYQWWKRIWVGIKYIFGYKSVYGEFDNVVIQQKDIPRMKKILEQFENNKPGEYKTYYLTIDSKMSLEHVRTAIERNDMIVDDIHKSYSSQG